MKAEWANENHHYTILLTPDNNHFEQLVVLERAGLIYQHDSSTPTQPIFVADRVLMQNGIIRQNWKHCSETSAVWIPCRGGALVIMWRCEKFRIPQGHDGTRDLLSPLARTRRYSRRR